MMLHQALHLCEELARLARAKPRDYKEALRRAQEIRIRFLEDPTVDPDLSAAVTQCTDCLREWIHAPSRGRCAAPLLRALRQLRWAVEYSYDGLPSREPRLAGGSLHGTA